MTEIVYFSIGFIFAFVMLITFGLFLKHVGTGNAKPEKKVVATSPEQDKKQKELERQYNNMLNYNGRVQRGVDDEEN